MPLAQSRARSRGAGKPRRPWAQREWAEDLFPGHQDCRPIFGGEFHTNCGVFCKVDFAAFYNEKQLSHLLSCHIRTIERTVGLEKLSCPSSKSSSSAELHNREKGHLWLIFALGYQRWTVFHSIFPTCSNSPLMDTFDRTLERNVKEVKCLS